ncbi:unnamed protein product [Meloidogyne enterolobii]|uniref:Uncharacterized protein n=1 Tax=Meloidogyne enterolobii TaxID=390850 RepID=A0ACB1ASI7_MELEN
MEPMATIEKSISNMYRNYEKVCEKLDKSAHCSQKCSLQDQSAFFQYTTFYRIHCIDFEEELESVLPCLREAAYKADIAKNNSFFLKVCREKCVAKQPAEKQMNKEERQKQLCKNVECATICYVNQLSNSCPSAKQTLIKLNVRIANEMRRLTKDEDFEKLSSQCQRVHLGEYLQKRLIESTK